MCENLTHFDSEIYGGKFLDSLVEIPRWISEIFSPGIFSYWFVLVCDISYLYDTFCHMYCICMSHPQRFSRPFRKALRSFWRLCAKDGVMAGEVGGCSGVAVVLRVEREATTEVCKSFMSLFGPWLIFKTDVQAVI